MGYQRRVHGRGTAINIGCTRSVLLEIMNSLARVSNTVRVIATRKMGTGQIQPGYEKIKAKQEFYQVPNGLLIHEKSAFDRGLYYTTAFLTVAGVVMSLKFFYDSSYPKKA